MPPQNDILTTSKSSNKINKKIKLIFRWEFWIAAILLIFLIFKFVEYIRPALLFPKWKDYKVGGIDISKYQGTIDWNTVKDQNISFVFVKATEGNYLVDKKFEQNWDNIKKASIIRGAYHFYRPYINWKLQAEFFKKTVELQKGDLPPVLDVEVIHSAGQEYLIEDMKKWLNDIEIHYGVKPIVYTYENFYNKYLLDEFRGYNLWIAKYGNFKPECMDDAHWEFWQYSETGKLNGISNPVDMNVFFGSNRQLQKILKK